jgi:hypothetical protein
VKDLVWLPKSRRFAACSTASNGKRNAQGAGDNLRVRAGSAFRRRAVGQIAPAEARRSRCGGVAARHPLYAEGGDDPAGTIELVFAGGGAIKLEVECIDAGLTDVSGEWAALAGPIPQIDET